MTLNVEKGSGRQIPSVMYIDRWVQCAWLWKLYNNDHSW